MQVHFGFLVSEQSCY